ncbi:MAG: hypothetical protein U0359_32100 [Byssovorax sp.]
MAQPVKPLEHVDPDKKSDEALRSEARSHLGATPSLQLVAELYTKLRTLDLPWWKPEMLRERWPAIERMRWLKARPDLRQKVTSALTGLQPRAARKKAPDFQGALIDAVIDEGDVSARAFEESFDPTDLVVYGPVEAFWSGFIEKMPWKQDTAVHQELVAWLFDALLSDHSAIDGMRRKPILTAWEARTAIDGRVWHTRMPLEIRVAIDEARFRKERERPGEPFHAASDLSIAVAQTIASSIPLRDLLPVFVAAEKIMGFGKPAPAPEPKKSDAAPEVAAPKPPAATPASPAVSVPATSSTSSTSPAVSSLAPAAAPAPAPAPAAAPATPAPSRPSVLPPASASPSIPPPAAAPFAPPPAVPMPPAPPVQPQPPAQPSSLRSLSSPPPALVSTPKPAPDAAPAAARPATPSSSLIGKPADRPTGSAPIEVAPAVRADFAGASAPAKPESAPKPASITSPRAAAATLIDALAHIPAEDERTNPWDIPSEDGSEDTGVTAPARRDEAGSGKRKRSGRG